MTNLSQVLSDLARNYAATFRSTERDCRLIFPGLTKSLAVRLHETLQHQLAEGSTSIPVYLALDYSGSPLEPDESKGWLHYEALTSVRQGSFVTVCMPKVFAKLHDSIRGTGSPIRGLTFVEEWPWKDMGVEAFRFSGPVLEAMLDKWSEDPEPRRWIREMVLKGLLPATAPLRDAIRVPLLLEDILESFAPTLYPELDNVVDKFCFHCGTPRLVNHGNIDTEDYIESVKETANALQEHRTNNPEFRDYLVNDIAESTFASLDPDSLQKLKNSLHLLLDGALKLGADSGLLAYRGGLGNMSSSKSIKAWSSLHLDRLRKLFGVGKANKIKCTASLPAGNGVVSKDGKKAAMFQGQSLQLNVVAEISKDGFALGEYYIRFKRRQHHIYEQECDESEFALSITIPPDELPGWRSRISLAVQLVRFQRVVNEDRIYVDICGEKRPALGVLEPDFKVIDLLKSNPESIDTESVMHTCREPVKVHVLDWQSKEPCQVTVDDLPVLLSVSEKSPDGSGSTTLYTVRNAIDAEYFSGARVDLWIKASEVERYVTLCGADIGPGEFTLEDELRVATSTANLSRLRRVLPFFRGDKDLILPKLAEIDASSRRRLNLGRLFERSDGWKPVLVDFVEPTACEGDSLVAQAFWREGGRTLSFLNDIEPTNDFIAAFERYVECRDGLIQSANSYVHGYAAPSERPLYIVAPMYVECEDEHIEATVSHYLDAYDAILRLLQSGSLSRAEIFTFVHLDSVVLQRECADDNLLDFRVSLLGPWHPLVVAKRFMVQYWIYAAAKENGRLEKRHRRLASLFGRIDGFRVVPGFDVDGHGLDVSFAFPTSDPGWHFAVASSAFSALAGCSFRSLRGFGEKLWRSLCLKSSLYLAGSDLWNENFVRSFQRSHPSRRQLGLRVSRGLDARAVVDSCVRLLDGQRRQSEQLGALLPGGIHMILEERLDQRQQLPWKKPAVFVYEALPDDRCYEKFQPDILLLGQREEVRPVWLSDNSEQCLGVPRGRGRGVVFSVPLVDLASDVHGLPLSRIRESGEAGGAASHVPEGEFKGIYIRVGEVYSRVLTSIDELVSQVRPQRPVLVQELGLPSSLRCDWTVFSGAHIDAGALASYIAGGGSGQEGGRVLWDYRLDVGPSVRAYFIVCKVPKSVLSSLAAQSLALGLADASAALRELAEVGFAVGETMRSGKAAVGVLGVVGALRLARAAWAAGEANGRRWCTVLLPVDCITDLLVASPDAETTGKRSDLLAINLVWQVEGASTLTISPCAVECKYVSASYPARAVQDALRQAEATYGVVSDLLSLAQSRAGMHARLAFCQILRFGLRLLAARGDVMMADERIILDSTLSGAFNVSPPVAPSLLVTTSCGMTGHGTVDVRESGWWVQLTSDCWPRRVPSGTNSLVGQLSKVFPVVEPHADEEGANRDGDTTSTRTAIDAMGSGGRLEIHQQAGGAPSTMRSDGEIDGDRFFHAASPEASYEANRREVESTDTKASKDLIHAEFNGFVGNNAAVEALSIQLRYVEETGSKSIRSVGLFGPKSTGKTELSRRLAAALGVPYLPLSETGLGNIDQLADRMQERAREAGRPMTVVDQQGGQAVLRSPPMLVFIDEVHQLSARVQDTLLPVLEADERMLRGSRVIIDARDVSFVIATTDWGKLREAFRSRVRDVMLEPYNTDEVVQMLRHRIEAHQGADVDPAVKQLNDDALAAIAIAARAVPREALHLLREIGMALRIGICDPSVDAVWGHLQKRVPCDRQGLTISDRKYLTIVANRGPIGLDNIATELGIDRSNIEGAIEPFLTQMGWVRRGATWRTLTTKGRRLLAQLPHQVQ